VVRDETRLPIPFCVCVRVINGDIDWHVHPDDVDPRKDRLIRLYGSLSLISEVYCLNELFDICF